jgi:phenylalanine-4-hydroxylase
VRSAAPRRVAFDLKRLMRTRYKIDTFQSSYFVIDDFRQLFDATAPDFTPIYAEVRGAPEIDAGAVLPGEREFAAG